jgi:hypothetical protein
LKQREKLKPTSIMTRIGPFSASRTAGPLFRWEQHPYRAHPTAKYEACPLLVKAAMCKYHHNDCTRTIPFGKLQIRSSPIFKRFAHKFYELLLHLQCECLLRAKSSGLNRRNKTPPLDHPSPRLEQAQCPDPSVIIKIGLIVRPLLCS